MKTKQSMDFNCRINESANGSWTLTFRIEGLRNEREAAAASKWLQLTVNTPVKQCLKARELPWFGFMRGPPS